MKKILFGILTFFGIGLSFCNADGLYHNSDLGLISFVIGGETKYTLSDKNEGATCTNVSNSCSYGTYSLFSNISCSDGFYLPDKSYYYGNFFVDFFNYLGVSTAGQKANALINYLYMPIAGLLNNGTFSDGSYAYYWFGDNRKNFTFYTSWGGYFSSDSSMSSSYSLVYRCFKSSVVEPDYTWSIITGDVLSLPSPKLKINYGSTSSTFEIADGDFIVNLESPVNVSQDGHTYSYNGSTGLNLFYNGTIQRYSKSELYLNSMYWYNNNIFTPICL